MSFNNGIDINAMFADAANAAENTGEDDPALLGEATVDKTDESSMNIKENMVENIESKDEEQNNKDEVKDEEKHEIKYVEVEKHSDKNAEIEVESEVEDNMYTSNNYEESKQENINSRKVLSTDNQQIDIVAIDKIIEMKKILDAYNPTELEFVEGYFQQEEGTSAEIIYEALTVDERELNALNKIVTARKHTAAERAFYLMDLDNNSIEAIFEQIELLTGELGDLQRVDELNKIGICRKLESSISNMSSDVFTYINKLQEFTNVALT